MRTFWARCFYGNEIRRILWVPVFIGVGIAAYFSLPAEPESGPTFIAATLAAVVFGVCRRRVRPLSAVALGVLIAVAGFGSAQQRTAVVDAPALMRETGPVIVSGQVRSIEPTEKGARLTLSEPVS